MVVRLTIDAIAAFLGVELVVAMGSKAPGSGFECGRAGKKRQRA
jgi:hypothetical protein